MKKITPHELSAFFYAMKKNGLEYRETPRTEEEINNLVVIYNIDTKQYYLVEIGTKLSSNERVVTPFEIFSHMTKDLSILENDTDNYSM